MSKDVKLIRSALTHLAKPGTVLKQISGDLSKQYELLRLVIQATCRNFDQLLSAAG